MTAPKLPEGLEPELRLLAASMRHSAGQWMVPGWDGHKVAVLLEKAQAALQALAAEKDAEIAALKLDAARYRWLRQYPNNLNGGVYGPTHSREGGGLLRRDTYLDAAIDSALALAAKEAK